MSNTTTSTYTLLPPPHHHLTLLPMTPAQLLNPNPNTLALPYPKPLNPQAIPYQKAPTFPSPPPKTGQLLLLLSKPYVSPEIYQPLPPRVPHSLAAPNYYYYYYSTFIYQHNNLKFPPFFTHPPPPVLAPRFQYTLNAVPAPPSPPSASLRDDQKYKATINMVNDQEKMEAINSTRERKVKKSRAWRRRLNLSAGEIISSEEHFWVPENHSSLGSGRTIVVDTGRRVGKICADVERKEKEVIDPQGKTSLMIRNIPNQFKRSDLIRILDKHCVEENKKAFLSGSDAVWSEYDFLYLPMDFKRLANLGYALVNFTNEVAASRFWKAFNCRTWRVSRNRKTCEIALALIQGKEGLRMHFANSRFPCHTDGYVPVTFSPPRNGTTLPKPTLVGKRVKPRAPIKSSPPSPTISRTIGG